MNRTAKWINLMMFKILYFLFVLFSSFHRVECAEVFAFFGFRVYFPGVDAVFA